MALLRELQCQALRVAVELEKLELSRARLAGEAEGFRTIEARLRGGMIDGFERLGMVQPDQKGGAS
jgi:hypothetical protein